MKKNKYVHKYRIKILNKPQTKKWRIFKIYIKFFID